MGPGSILQERRHSQLEDITAENGAWPHLFSPFIPKVSLSFGVRLCHHVESWTSFYFEHYRKIKSDPACPLSLSHGFFTIQPSPS